MNNEVRLERLPWYRRLLRSSYELLMAPFAISMPRERLPWYRRLLRFSYELLLMAPFAFSMPLVFEWAIGFRSPDEVRYSIAIAIFGCFWCAGEGWPIRFFTYVILCALIAIVWVQIR